MCYSSALIFVFRSPPLLPIHQGSSLLSLITKSVSQEQLTYQYIFLICFSSFTFDNFYCFAFFFQDTTLLSSLINQLLTPMQLLTIYAIVHKVQSIQNLQDSDKKCRTEIPFQISLYSPNVFLKYVSRTKFQKGVYKTKFYLILLDKNILLK